MSKAKKFIVQMYNEHKEYYDTLTDIAAGKHGVCEHVINARAVLKMPAAAINAQDGVLCEHVFVSIYKMETYKTLFSTRITQTFDFMYCSKCGQSCDAHGEPVYEAQTT